MKKRKERKDKNIVKGYLDKIKNNIIKLKNTNNYVINHSLSINWLFVAEALLCLEKTCPIHFQNKLKALSIRIEYPNKFDIHNIYIYFLVY